MIELRIESIRVSLMNYQRVVVLKEKGAERFLPIWIGAAEADAIAVRLQDVSVARPMTHDLLSNALKEFGASVRRVVVNDLNNDTFYARIHISDQRSAPSRSTPVLAPPSPSPSAPLPRSSPRKPCSKKPGVVMDKEGEMAVATQAGERPPPTPVKEEDLEKMSAFRDFIESP